MSASDPFDRLRREAERIEEQQQQDDDDRDRDREQRERDPDVFVEGLGPGPEPEDDTEPAEAPPGVSYRLARRTGSGGVHTRWGR